MTGADDHLLPPFRPVWVCDFASVPCFRQLGRMGLHARPRAIRSHLRDGVYVAASPVPRWLDLHSRGHKCASGFVGT